MPNEAPGLMAAQITSKILPIITCEHSLMNAEGLHKYSLLTYYINPIIFCCAANNVTHLPLKHQPCSPESSELPHTSSKPLLID